MNARWRRAVIAIALVTGTAVPVPASGSLVPGEELTPSGVRRNTAAYVRMRDGVELAVDVWLPPQHRRGDRWPALMKTTRYWRAAQTGWLQRLLLALHLQKPEKLVDRQRDYFNHRGFVVLKVDARGSGASGGSRAVEYAPAEIADLGEVAAWAARQPWSDGHVGTFGVSYDGNLAEMAAVPDQPVIGALMPLYDDFDSQALVQPGGVLLRAFIEEWGRGVAALDRDDICAAAGARGFACWRLRAAAPGVKRVDADRGGTHLAALVARHRTPAIAEEVGRIEFRDDSLTTAAGRLTFADLSPYGHRREIERTAAPMMVWAGWLDAGAAEGALLRFRTFSNPQTVVIGPLSHGGGFRVDPYAAAHLPPVPSLPEQYAMEADFFAQVLRHERAAASGSTIRYYTMGEGAWHTTTTWPPAGLHAERLYLAEQHALASAPPAEARASDLYPVDFTASSGRQTRWHTQLGSGDVVYPDRTAEDRKLLTYTGPPLTAGLEITGSPVLHLVLASTAADGAVHAYLEDVSPDGRVTYLDEGVFRVIHRREADPRSLPFQPLGPAHSFQRRDAEPLAPGIAATVRFALFPTSIVVPRGHRLRLALAGADAGLFARYPAQGDATWTVFRQRDQASYLELPVRER